MRKTDDFIRREEKVSAKNYHPLPVVITKGEGVWVNDVEGKKYLDMLSAYSALNQGHCHPTIVKAATEQMNRLTLTSRAFHNDKMVTLLEKLSQLSGFEQSLLMNSGAEAVETSIKAMRRWGELSKGVPKGKAEIIVMEQNFHGRTSTIISFSSDEGSRKGYGPYSEGFVKVPYGDVQSLKLAVNSNTVGVLLEPIQGEAGVIIPPNGFLRACELICKDKNILFTVDEIQTGFGRTGKLFCYEHEEVKPDIVVVGKALGGGVYPVSGILASKELMDIAFEPGSHGSTFGGNPLACTVALAAIKVLEDEELVKRSNEMGDYFRQALKEIESDKIKEVRGKGLLLAIELTESAGGARQYTKALLEKGVLAKETHEIIIRFAPPLIITKEEIDWAVAQIKSVLG